MRLTIATKSVLTVCLLITLSLTLVGLFLAHRERVSLVHQVVARLEALTTLLASEALESTVSGTRGREGSQPERKPA